MVVIQWGATPFVMHELVRPRAEAVSAPALADDQALDLLLELHRQFGDVDIWALNKAMTKAKCVKHRCSPCVVFKLLTQLVWPDRNAPASMSVNGWLGPMVNAPSEAGTQLSRHDRSVLSATVVVW